MGGFELVVVVGWGIIGFFFVLINCLKWDVVGIIGVRLLKILVLVRFI